MRRQVVDLDERKGFALRRHSRASGAAWLVMRSWWLVIDAVLRSLLHWQWVVWIVHIAGGLTPICNGEEGWGCHGTAERCVVTALGKAATRRRVCGWPHTALNYPQPL